MEDQQSQYNFVNMHSIEIDINSDRAFWHSYILKIIKLVPLTCTLFNKGDISLNNNDSIYNPIIGSCTNNKYRKVIFLKSDTILNPFPKISVSIIYYILKIWITENKNATEIHKLLSSNLKN